jgi:small-conductance mechanosensitive channel
LRIPFNAESGEAIEERRRNWRRHDPINLVAKYRAKLKSLRGIYIVSSLLKNDSWCP